MTDTDCLRFICPPQCPDCSGCHRINYISDYITHRVVYHKNLRSTVIKDLVKILEKEPIFCDCKCPNQSCRCGCTCYCHSNRCCCNCCDD